MADESEMLRAIREAPDDDTLRVIYADWLVDRGDPRGELIHLQCELTKSPTGARALAIRQRAQELLDRHGDGWGPFSDPRIRWVFERGFVCGIGHRGVFHHEDGEGTWVRLYPDGSGLYIVTGPNGNADIVANWFVKGHQHSTELVYTLTEREGRVHIATRSNLFEAVLQPFGALDLTLPGHESIRLALEGERADTRRGLTGNGAINTRMIKHGP